MTLTKRKTLLTVAAALVVLLAAGVVWVTRSHSDTASGEPGSVQPAGLPRAESKCGLPGTPGTPTEIRANWENVAGWFLPVSSTDGPARRNPTGAWSCFARTPTGAVLAGAVIPMRADGVAEDWQSVVREQTIPGQGQTAKLESTPTQASEVVTLRGFSIVAYSDTRATINYYLPTSSMQTSCTVDVVWYSGDWRLQLGADGSTASGCMQGVPTSFVPWGP